MSEKNNKRRRLSIRIVPEHWDEYVEEERTKGLDPHLSRLREIARSRLDFQGFVVIRGIPGSEMAIAGLSYAQSSINIDGEGHIIEYNKDVRVEDSTFFHEFCHVKIDEMGFREAQSKVNGRASDCFSSEELWHKLAAAKNSVSEVYANYLLYRYFKKECQTLKNEEDKAFTSAENLRRIVREFGFDGIADISGYRIERNWLGEDSRTSRMAFREAFNGTPEMHTYNQVSWVFSRLPRARESSEIQQLTNAEVETISDCVWRIFKLRTGIDWRKCW